MGDQAAHLRQRIERFRNQNKTKVISIISGKGGVGKSVFSLNFSIALCKQKKRVILIDLDIGMANIDILLGLNPSSDIVKMLNNRQPVTDIIVQGPEGLSFIAGGSGLSDLFRLDELKLSYFLSQLTILGNLYDYIILDLGAGVSKDMLSFTLSSHQAFLVTNTEPTALTDAYAVLKTVHLNDQTLPVKLLVNRCDNHEEGLVYAERIQKAAKLFLKKELPILGYLNKDRAVEIAVKKQIPFLIDNPYSHISREIKQIAQQFTGNGEGDNNQRTFTVFMNKLKNFLTKKDG